MTLHTKVVGNAPNGISIRRYTHQGCIYNLRASKALHHHTAYCQYKSFKSYSLRKELIKSNNILAPIEFINCG